MSLYEEEGSQIFKECLDPKIFFFSSLHLKSSLSPSLSLLKMTELMWET